MRAAVELGRVGADARRRAGPAALWAGRAVGREGAGRCAGKGEGRSGPPSGPRPGKVEKKKAGPVLGWMKNRRFFSNSFFLFCFQSQFKCKPNANSNRVLNILFISNINEQFW